MTKPPLFMARDLIQNAWVVSDLEAAMLHWTTTCGVGPFFVADHIPMEDLKYRGMPATLDCSIALAQAGRMQIELIAQNCQSPSAYRDLVPAGQTAFHHVCVFARDYDREIAGYKAQGYEIASSGRFGDMRFCYVDTSSRLNCMIELLEESQLMRDHFRMISDAAENWDGHNPVRPAF